MLRYQLARRTSSRAYAPTAAGGEGEIVRLGQSPSQDVPTESKDTQEITQGDGLEIEEEKDRAASLAFRQQIAAFLILEFGILFHSVIIGLTLGSSGPEFSVLYPVIVFHQSFEGLGIGARLSAIPFPRRHSWMPWWLCAGYGLTTPIAIAIGLGVRTTYNADAYTANVASGLLDSISAGILIYTGLVELMARDFLFSPDRTNDDRQLAFMAISMLLGAGIMALLGKWA
jgi:zinc transporter 1/2/3